MLRGVGICKASIFYIIGCFHYIANVPDGKVVCGALLVVGNSLIDAFTVVAAKEGREKNVT